MKTRSVIIIAVVTALVTALGEYALLRGAFWHRVTLFKEEMLRANARISDERRQKEHAYKMYHALSEAYRQRDVYLNSLSDADRSLYARTSYRGGMNIRDGQYEIAFSKSDSDDIQTHYVIHVILDDDLSLVSVSHKTVIK